MGPLLGAKIIFKEIIQHPFDEHIKEDKAEVDHDPGSFDQHPIADINHRQRDGQQKPGDPKSAKQFGVGLLLCNKYPGNEQVK